MGPLTLFAAQKFASKLTSENILQQQVAALSAAAGVGVPTLPASSVVLSSSSADLGDRSIQLTYPRVCVYSSGAKNAQAEKFRTFSGTVALVAEVWASGNLLTDTDQWIHFYVEGLTEILRGNIGDWGDGMFFPGTYDVQFQSPKAGGFGYVESAKVTLFLQVSLS